MSLPISSHFRQVSANITPVAPYSCTCAPAVGHSHIACGLRQSAGSPRKTPRNPSPLRQCSATVPVLPPFSLTGAGAFETERDTTCTNSQNSPQSQRWSSLPQAAPRRNRQARKSSPLLLVPQSVHLLVKPLVAAALTSQRAHCSAVSQAQRSQRTKPKTHTRAQMLLRRSLQCSRRPVHLDGRRFAFAQLKTKDAQCSTRS